MAKILELREISFAVQDFDQAFKKFRALGFKTSPIWDEPTPPVQARLTSMPVGNSSISIMQSLGENTPITRFIKKRGEGIFSFTFLVDDIHGITAEWKRNGVEFVLDKPMEVRQGYSVGQPIPIILGNWTRPATLHGILIEFQDFRNEDGSPYRPPRRADEEPALK
jgi:methylmalonyl-CoA/ethylmalonyl-CoA epimerase